MRKLAVVLLSCLALTACAASWQQELRYKIVAKENQSSSEFFEVELVGDAPKGTLEPGQLKRQFLLTYEVQGAQVGDELLCSAEQEKGNAFGNSNVVTHLKNCKKA
ncbi:hypothetical protein OG205_34285 [Lentzea sp. NBC_00516]|uniref:hypothetical protein n=1 Tax=Lentzea sp. NBC_00516 TaxID=2903582 RepID=UPI002E7FEDA7|nr:hypothetical protein [Lentzea sp. NBC_00516]WUD23101.1 hypothetical protein OG205_34285 [Lentzea sp. NBC_00516]